MKKYVLILLIFSGAVVKNVNGQVTDPVVTQLLAIDVAYYTGKPLDSIIAVLPAGYIEMKIFGIRNTARFIGVFYPNKVWIQLHVREFVHINPYDANKAWDITQMRKEKLHSVTIYKKSVCYSGCPSY